MKIYYSELFKNIIFIKNYYKYFFRLIREKISYLLAGYDTKLNYEYGLFVGSLICIKSSISSDDFYKKNLKLSNKRIKELSLSLNEYIDSFKKNIVLDESMGGSANLLLLNNICEVLKPKSILETGIAQGYSSLTFLRYLSNNNGSLTSIDLPYMNINDSRSKIGYLVPKSLQKYWNKIIQPDFYYLKKLVSNNIKFDLIHYDSDKSLKGKIQNFDLIWILLKKGGYFICDDISDDGYFHYFANKKSLSPIVINFQNKFQGILIKN